MLLLDSGTLTRVMEMIHPPILLAQDWDNIIVNSVMGAALPPGFTMPTSNLAFIVPTTMIAEIKLLFPAPLEPMSTLIFPKEISQFLMDLKPRIVMRLNWSPCNGILNLPKQETICLIISISRVPVYHEKTA